MLLCECVFLIGYAYPVEARAVRSEATAPADAAPPGTLGTVRNAVLLLDLLSDGPPFQQLTDLAERSGLSLPTVHRLLRSLAVAGLVGQDPHSLRYGLGPELVRLSERYVTRLPVVSALAPYLVELRDATGATVLAGLLMRGCVVYVDRVDGEDAGGVFREHTRMRPALETAAGRLLAARSGDEAWLEATTAFADGRVGRGDRERWAHAAYVLLADGPFGDRREVAVPVLGGDGRVLAALSARARMEEDELVERVVPQLARAAGAVSRALAHA
jgi:IclR family transcriptional regulator, acetate operon repressor